MHNSRFAEPLLALVTSPERAAAMVGDFTESSRGPFWFWSSVTCAGLSLLWKDVAASPGRMAVLTASAAVMLPVMSAPFLVGLFLSLVTAVIIFQLLHLDASGLFSPFFALMVMSLVVPSPFLTGRWLARRAPGRELAPCLALTILTAVLWIVAYSIWRSDVSLMNGLAGTIATLLCLLLANASLYAGAIWVRRHPSELAWFEGFPSSLLPDRAASTARQREQRIGDRVAYAEVAGLLLLRVIELPPLQGWFYAAVAGFMALLCLLYAVTGRHFEGIRLCKPIRSWPGRLAFAGMGVALAWAAWSELL